MKSKIILSLSVLLSATLLFLFYGKESPGIQLQPESAKKSGAFEALNFFGSSRTYPYDVLPETAHFAAWKEAIRMQEAVTSNRGVDPWESIGPHNRGGRTLGLAFNPQNTQTLYAGSASGGLWRSYTAGTGKDAWERVETGFPLLGVSVIEFMPDDSTRLFIGTGEVYNYTAAGTGAAYRSTRGSYGIGILRSQDGGESWESSLDFSYDQNKGIWDIEIAPSNPDIIYAATTDGVYKSTDGGDSWDWILDVVMATDLVVHPEDPDKVVVGCGNFASPNFGIYRTTDGGTFWYKISSGLPSVFNGKIQLAHAPSAPDILYASIGNGFSSANGASWLCYSDNFGLTWEIRNETDYSQWQGWFSHDVAVHPQNPDEIIVIGIEVWKSTDGGFTLDRISVGGVGFANPPIEGPDGNPNYVHSDCHDVIFHPESQNVFYVASDGGIHRSLDGGISFASCNGRYQTAQFYNGFSNSGQDPDFCQGGLQDNGTIQWNGSTEGVTWTRVSGGDGSWTATNPLNDDVNYVSSQFLNVRRTYSGNSGYTGMNIPTAGTISFIAPFVIAPSDGDILYAGSSVIAKTTDRGDNWFTTNSGNPLDGNPALSMSISATNTDVVYVGTAPNQGDPGGVFVTQNGGNSWNDVTAGLPDRYPMDIQVDPTDDGVAYVAFSGFGTGHVFRTTDYGASWEDISEGLPDVPANAIEVDPLFPNNIYVGNDLGVFVSTDYGNTWNSYHEGLYEAVMVFDLKISPVNRKLRAATHGNGAFQRDLLEEPLVSTRETKGAKHGFATEAFPNPASGFTRIRYELPGPQKVKITVTDQSGNRVIELPVQDQAAGQHTTRLELDRLIPGMYYYEVRTEQSKSGGRILINR